MNMPQASHSQFAAGKEGLAALRMIAPAGAAHLGHTLIDNKGSLFGRDAAA